MKFYGRDLVALEEMKLSETPAPAQASCRSRADCGWANQLVRISTHSHKKQKLDIQEEFSGNEARPSNPSTPSSADDEALPDVVMLAALNAHDFDRLDDEGREPDVYEAYVAQDPDCATVLDDDGGLQIKTGGQLGEYLVQVDGHQYLSEESDQSGSDNDADSPSSSSDRNHLSEGSESGSESMSEDE